MRPDRAQSSQWMDRASSGDAGAFGLLATAVQDELYRFALAHGLRSADAAEAVQETLLRAYRTRRRWRCGGDAVAWLYGIALNVVREFCDRSRRREADGLDLDLLRTAGGEAEAAGDRAAELRQLARAIRKLAPRQREAVTCRHLLEMSVRDTAAAMGCAEGTVKAAVAAGLQNLRKAMRAPSE